jgi:hypothetical protein
MSETNGPDSNNIPPVVVNNADVFAAPAHHPATRRLAFWMRLTAMVGIISMVLTMLLAVRNSPPFTGEAVVMISVASISLVFCLFWMFLWQCGGLFSRIAATERIGEPLAIALSYLKVFFILLASAEILGIALIILLAVLNRSRY